jgi:glycosyltransferase involved in cell wall biosynthesis
VRYLFIHQNFPGQFQHIVLDILARNAGDEIVFIAEPNNSHISGVRRVNYRMRKPESRNLHRAVGEFEQAHIRADEVERVARSVKALGFTPDVIVGHHGWGELLNIQDVFPGVPVVGYFEFYYHVAGADVGFDPEFPLDPSLYSRVRAKNGVNLLALNNPGIGQCPTQWQRSTYPDWAQKKIRLVPDGVNLDVCKPDPDCFKRDFVWGDDWKIGPDQKLVTYVSRDLEPYRGYHIMMRSLPRLLRERPDLHVALVGGDKVSYGAAPPKGNWREHFLNEVRDQIDLSRVHFLGKVKYEDYVRLLQRGNAHVYLTYPFVASWSLREALGMGCAVVGSDTPPVTEFVTHDQNGLLVPFLEPQKLADTVLELLENQALNKRLRQAARAYAKTNLPMAKHLKAFHKLIGEAVGG